MSRDGAGEIPIHKKKSHPDEHLRLRIFDFANRVLRHSNLDPELWRRRVIQKCATVLFYDHGYKEVKGISNMHKTWGKRAEESYQTGSTTNPMKSRNKGSVSYVAKFEEEHPGKVRELYRYAERTIGNQSSYRELAHCMNEKARVDGLGETKFSAKKVWRWFKDQGGKEKSPIEKPLLTEEAKKERKAWCEKVLAKIADYGDNFHACYLDEKWFYTTSRRRKLKILPPGPGEDPKEVEPHIPTTRSRRFTTKVSHVVVLSVASCMLLCAPP